MNKYEPEQEKIERIYKDHKKWLDGKEGGARADFSGMYLRGVSMKHMDFRRAIFQGADLSESDL